MSSKVRENRARRAAARQGFQLQKHRARDPRHVLFGTFQIVDATTGAPVHADPGVGRGYGLDIDDVESYLERPVA